jgi:LPXTG-motif cell wall-anchored protein
MTLKSLYGVAVVALVCGVGAADPAYAQARRDGHLLPQEKSGNVTAVGCLLKGTDVRGGKSDKYVLARPKAGPVGSVHEASCTADAGADALTVDNPEKGKITDAALGHWVEITGRLEKETDKNPDNLREIDVATFKLVPVVIPTKPAAAPAKEPAAAPAPAPRAAAPAPRPAEPTSSPAPAAPAPEPKKLPKTASQLPAIGLAGLLLLAVAFTLRGSRRRQQG